MFHRAVLFVLTAVLSTGPATEVAADPSACLNCHDAEEFSEVDVAMVAEALADPGIPPHGRFAGLTDEEVEALLAVLTE